MRLYVSERSPEIARDTYPNALHIEGNTIGRNAFVVGGFEDVVFPSLVHKATTESVDIGLECVRLEEFMGESREREVEVVFQLAIPEFRWL